MRVTGIFLTFLLLVSTITTFSQKYVYDVNRTELHDDMLYDNVRRIIRLPSVNGLIPIKCDFHIHTVFSDGDVWPTARVREAWQDGLDAIAITDHTSAAPSKRNVTGGPNASYEIAKPEADRRGMILIQATEITRDKPEGGHLNALFITDAAKTLDIPTEDAVREAVKQGGYIIWNHPGWAIDTCMMFDVNRRLIESGHIHAIEVFNEAEWYPRVLIWLREFNLAPIAASDIHYLTNSFYRISNQTIRPMTIVLARVNTQEAIKEALNKRSTIAFFNGMLAGNTQLLTDLFHASVSVKKTGVTYDRNRNATNHYKFINPYDVPFVIQLESSAKKITLHPQSEISFSLSAKTGEVSAQILNLHTYEHETLSVTLLLPE